jgi:general secretion pathway protein M
MNQQQMMAWYQGLAERDQRILRIGAVVALLLLILALLLPLQRAVSGARTRIEHKQSDLAWMRTVAPTLAAAGPAPSAPGTQESLVVLVDRSARESGLGQSLTGSQPSGKGALRVQLEKAEFNLLVAWLARLSSQQGVQVETANIEQADAGLVSATIVLHSP